MAVVKSSAVSFHVQADSILTLSVDEETHLGRSRGTSSSPLSLPLLKNLNRTPSADSGFMLDSPSCGQGCKSCFIFYQQRGLFKFPLAILGLCIFQMSVSSDLFLTAYMEPSSFLTLSS